MNFLKTLSIQRQLMFLAGFFALGMIGPAMISQLTNQQVRELAQARLVISEIGAGMLTLRRNEKDFMARRDLKYVDRFSANFEAMLADVDRMQVMLSDQGVDNKEAEQLNQVFNDYLASFMRIAATIETIGLDPKSGLYDALRQAVHHAEGILKEQNQVQLTVDMLILRRREKDFMLRLDMSCLDKFNKDVTVFEQHLEQSSLGAETRSAVVKAMQDYQRDFKALVEGYVTLGLSSSEGQHGPFTRAKPCWRSSLKGQTT